MILLVLFCIIWVPYKCIIRWSFGNFNSILMSSSHRRVASGMLDLPTIPRKTCMASVNHDLICHLTKPRKIYMGLQIPIWKHIFPHNTKKNMYKYLFLAIRSRSCHYTKKDTYEVFTYIKNIYLSHFLNFSVTITQTDW